MCCNRVTVACELRSSLPVSLLWFAALLGTSIYSPFALSGREVRRAVLKVGLI